MTKGTSFEAMGTTFELLLDVENGIDVSPSFNAVEREVRRLERILSRFDEGSELSRLNRAGTLEVGPELVEIVGRALAARTETDGRFDPTVHDALVAAGYDRPFAEIPADQPATGADSCACGGAVRVDVASGRVDLEPGVRLDLGAIAKGWTADRVLPILAAHGPALVNAGGDVAACGRTWPIRIEAAGDLTVAIECGGLATSGVDRRRWRTGGTERHHLIDPRTGTSAATDLLTVTAAAETAADAEVLATSLYLAGSIERAAAEADARSFPAVLVARDGDVVQAGGLR
ncbi:MAG: FAD:protein FMN transferase [Actinobacteria bacterium]|nr:FAD:protein FMN transferase [Actinomycetota bacterium]